MSVKFFDAPISDDELGNLNEASPVVTLDAPTITFKRQRVATAPMQFRPGTTPGRVDAVIVAAAEPVPRERHMPRRLGQWLLAAAIVAGLGVAGHFVGAGARASTANPPSRPMQPDVPVATTAPAREIVATPVVRIAAPTQTVTAEAQPVAKPKPREHARREAAPAVDTSTESAKADTAKTDTAKTESAKTGAEDDLMRQAAETLSNAQLESP